MNDTTTISGNGPRRRKTQQYTLHTAQHPLSVPDVDWGGRFDSPKTVSDDVPKPDMAVKLPTVEIDAQIDSVLRQSAEDLNARLDRLVAENPHWGRLR
jgi:hypothetical protein